MRINSESHVFDQRMKIDNAKILDFHYAQNQVQYGCPGGMVTTGTSKTSHSDCHCNSLRKCFKDGACRNCDGGGGGVFWVVWMCDPVLYSI